MCVFAFSHQLLFECHMRRIILNSVFSKLKLYPFVAHCAYVASLDHLKSTLQQHFLRWILFFWHMLQFFQLWPQLNQLVCFNIIYFFYWNYLKHSMWINKFIYNIKPIRVTQLGVLIPRYDNNVLEAVYFDERDVGSPLILSCNSTRGYKLRWFVFKFEWICLILLFFLLLICLKG